MDPNATLTRIILESSRDKHAYAEACEDLAQWLARGGFKPTIPPGMRYIPGTGTRWAVWSPAGDFPVWTLAHYDARGMFVAAYPLQ